MTLHRPQHPFRIELTDEEAQLLAGIELDARALGDRQHPQTNGDAVTALMHSLLTRNAIPAIRTAYFTDPALNAAGRGRSIEGIFVSNGIDTHEKLFRHPHFLEHLRYFIFGPRLPTAAIAAFSAEVTERGSITSSDAIPLAKHARAVARQHHLSGRETADEFYKLALELGIDASYAALIRENIRKIR